MIDRFCAKKRRRFVGVLMPLMLLGGYGGAAIGKPAAPQGQPVAARLRPAPGPAAGLRPKIISAWTHEDADSAEFEEIKKTADAFNRRQHAYRIELVSSLRRDHESWVRRAAASGTLPCLLDFDGPQLAGFAWPQYFQPIDRFVTAKMLDDFLPTVVAQGSYQGRLYSLGQFDSGVVLWGNRRYLRAAGVRIPTLSAPWSLAEFEQALARLAALKELDYAINFSFYNGRGSEFFTYAYSPILQGFGGDLIDRRHDGTAKGVLDGPQSVAAMKRIQRWIDAGWTRAVGNRPNDFAEGKTALSWNGHWAYLPAYKALGKDLVLMPLPDFGRGIKTGTGSWGWAISSTCHEPDGAWAFLADLLSTKAIVRMTNLNSAVPARRSALAQSPLYGARGPLRLIVQQLEMGGVPRPFTPAYATLSIAFRDAVGNVVGGGDVQSALSNAADTVDQKIAAHRGYPYP